MKTLKIFFIIAIVSNFTQCKTMKLTDNPPFEINGATYNNWVGGQPGVSGMKVNIGVNTDKEITFNTMYFYKMSTKVEIKTVKGKKYVVGHFNTSTHDQDMLVEPNMEKKKKEHKEEKHFDLKENEAVISYTIGAKTKYYKVTNIKRTKTDFYP